jgi:hypothetical protein
MKIKLSGKYAGLVALCDDERLDVLAHRWYGRKSPSGVYAHTWVGGKFVQMHRFVLPSRTAQIDHINRNTLDNRAVNLRPCSHSQNQANRPAQTNSSTGIKGVFFESNRSKPFRARLRYRGKLLDAGRFRTASEAAQAYNALALSLFGEFALLNPIDTT